MTLELEPLSLDNQNRKKRKPPKRLSEEECDSLLRRVGGSWDGSPAPIGWRDLGGGFLTAGRRRPLHRWATVGRFGRVDRQRKGRTYAMPIIDMDDATFRPLDGNQALNVRHALAFAEQASHLAPH